MKKLIFIAYMMCICTYVFAQKKINTGLVLPKDNVALVKPDLMFPPVPMLLGNGKFVPVEGLKGWAKIVVSFEVKNAGFSKSKPAKVLLQLLYQRPRTFKEVEQNIGPDEWLGYEISAPMPLQAIDPGKKVMRIQNFTFAKIPDEVWGKNIRLVLEIVYPEPSGELSTENNKAQVIEMKMEK